MKTPSSQLSFIPRFLELFYDDPDLDSQDRTKLAGGTGFFYEYGQELYMITNWHLLTGRHPETHQVLADHGGVPNKVGLDIGVSIDKGPKDKDAFIWDGIIVDLWDKNRNPKWFEHPDHGSDVDVVALPFPYEREEGYRLFPITDASFKPFAPQIGLEAFILGYPLGIAEPGGLPVWKRATIATEPRGKIKGLPKVYVDTKTREGMSGAPVIVQYRGFYQHNPETPGVDPDDYWGVARDFWGIYSGRLGEDEFRAQLGIVWKKTVIEEIIEGKTRTKL